MHKPKPENFKNQLLLCHIKNKRNLKKREFLNLEHMLKSENVKNQLLTKYHI